jgi:hypothetical protein
MASPIENHLQQLRLPLALRARSAGEQVSAGLHSIAQRKGSERSERTLKKVDPYGGIANGSQ